jgi:response regulator RpfG family c-di-GMP phosphodiesterase
MEDAQASSMSLRKVLLVDDEPLVVSFLKTALRMHGFLVWPAASGKEALRLLGEHPQEIGLALLEQRLPDMSIDELLAGLLRINPALRCCVMGGTADLDEDILRASGAVNVVRKPLALNSLSHALWGVENPAPPNP